MIRSGELGARVAQSRNADLYGLDRGWLVKLFRPHIRFAMIVEEHRIAQLVARSGLRVPATRSHLLRNLDDGRYGIVFEHVPWPTVSEQLKQQPAQVARHARLLADLHRGVHATRAPTDLPPFRARLQRKIAGAGCFSNQERTRLLAQLDHLPEGDVLCHGDFHRGNVLLAPDAPALIDWGDAARGDAICDVARTWVLLRIQTFRGSRIADIYARVFTALYLRRYRHASPLPHFSTWCLVNAAARVSENVRDDDRALLLRYVRRRLRRGASHV